MRWLHNLLISLITVVSRETQNFNVSRDIIFFFPFFLLTSYILTEGVAVMLSTVLYLNFFIILCMF